MAGILPFGAVFIELFFIFNALWENQFYYLFGFLFLVFWILVVSVSQISIVMVYFQLCGEVSMCIFNSNFSTLKWRWFQHPTSIFMKTLVLQNSRNMTRIKDHQILNISQWIPFYFL